MLTLSMQVLVICFVLHQPFFGHLAEHMSQKGQGGEGGGRRVKKGGLATGATVMDGWGLGYL